MPVPAPLPTHIEPTTAGRLKIIGLVAIAIAVQVAMAIWWKPFIAYVGSLPICESLPWWRGIILAAACLAALGALSMAFLGYRILRAGQVPVPDAYVWSRTKIHRGWYAQLDGWLSVAFAVGIVVGSVAAGNFLNVPILWGAASAICSSPPPPPPPPPPPDMVVTPESQAAARKRALALGVGPCEDLVKIKTLTFRDELGVDLQFDRMVVNFAGYRACLIAKITDTTPIPDPSCPARHPYAIGDLAYDLIGSSGFMDYDTCIPAEISERWKRVGARALVEWTAIAGNREKLQRCVADHFAAL